MSGNGKFVELGDTVTVKEGNDTYTLKIVSKDPLEGETTFGSPMGRVLRNKGVGGIGFVKVKNLKLPMGVSRESPVLDPPCDYKVKITEIVKGQKC